MERYIKEKVITKEDILIDYTMDYVNMLLNLKKQVIYNLKHDKKQINQDNIFEEIAHQMFLDGWGLEDTSNAISFLYKVNANWAKEKVRLFYKKIGW